MGMVFNVPNIIIPLFRGISPFVIYIFDDISKLVCNAHLVGALVHFRNN